MAALPWLLLARCPDVPLGSGPPTPGPRCCWSVGAGMALGHTSQGEATCAGSAQPGRSARCCCGLCRDSGIQPHQLPGERLRRWEGWPVQGMAFCTVSPAVGSWSGRTAGSQAKDPPEMANGPLTTHVLNTATGLPAAGLAIRLSQLQEPGQQWTELVQRWTDADGRCLPLLAVGQAEAGTYKLRFETAAYWQGLGHASFYPFVEVVFTITDASQKLHIPLLISPYSYTTYRGS
ncbi:transthyretin-like isoform X3 [Falco peregrinus]|uniref:transthyretin-like isoform X3 n=1 Tax=Falco peregrinus TaxID=8954 RepID=UPI000FFBCFE7|nr:transthyretin-like isoform X3 [Falco peregrinus]